MANAIFNESGKRIILLSIILFTSVLLFSFYQSPEPSLEESMEKGKMIYNTYCMSCHRGEGEGIAGVYPPLAGKANASSGFITFFF